MARGPVTPREAEEGQLMPAPTPEHDLHDGEPRIRIELDAPQGFEAEARFVGRDTLVVGVKHRNETGIRGSLHVVLAAQRVQP